MARPRATRCLWPPDSCPGFRAKRGSIFNIAATFCISSSMFFNFLPRPGMKYPSMGKRSQNVRSLNFKGVIKLWRTVKCG